MSDASTKKREKILIIIASLAVLYGIIDFLILPSSKGQKPNTAKITAKTAAPTVITGELLALSSSRQTSDATAILELAGSPWPSSVFARCTSLAEPKTAATIQALDPETFEYSGYMDMGDSRLAIINGRDYQQNEIIEGFTLLEISPLHILLGKESNTFMVLFKAPEELPEVKIDTTRATPRSAPRKAADDTL